MCDRTFHNPIPWLLRGFTLVELITSIAVLAVVLTIAAPSFYTLLQNNRIMTQIDGLTNTLNYARTTALNQNINVMVCPALAAGSTTCGTNWSHGWIVITQPGAGAPVLLQENIAGANDPVLSSVAVNTAAAVSVTFDPVGLATSNANFKSCDSRGSAYARSVEVLPTGFIQSSTNMGIAAWNGGALACP